MDELDKDLDASGMHIEGDDDLDEEGMPKKIVSDEDAEEDEDEAPM